MFDLNQLINKNTFFLIAGPCVIEEEKLAFNIASHLKDICFRLKIPFVFKASYKKANRTKLDSFTGIGDNKALTILKNIKHKLNIPITTDVHSINEINIISNYVDIIQIPAFLCRQTDLLITAAKTGKIVNIKKGQFISGENMKFAVEKIKKHGNEQILLTERGTMFGYKDLIVDIRNIPIMQNYAPVILDITHSLQQPNQDNGITAGTPKLIETIAKSGLAAGVNGIFLETHPEPLKAKSDGKNMLQIDLLEDLLRKLLKIKKAII